MCLPDYSNEILKRIYTDKVISKMLQESGNTVFKNGIDAFWEFSSEDSIEESKDLARQIWSYDLSMEIANAIKKIAEENFKEN